MFVIQVVEIVRRYKPRNAKRSQPVDHRLVKREVLFIKAGSDMEEYEDLVADAKRRYGKRRIYFLPAQELEKTSMEGVYRLQL